MFKFYTYSCRSSGKVNVEYLKTDIYKTKNTELEVNKTKHTFNLV